MRELNRSGVLKKLEALDTKYLQKIFVGAQLNREVELSEVSHPAWFSLRHALGEAVICSAAMTGHRSRHALSMTKPTVDAQRRSS